MNPSQFRHHDIITPKRRMKRESNLLKTIKAKFSAFYLDDIAVTVAVLFMVIVAFGGISAL